MFPYSETIIFIVHTKTSIIGCIGNICIRSRLWRCKRNCLCITFFKCFNSSVYRVFACGGKPVFIFVAGFVLNPNQNLFIFFKPSCTSAKTTSCHTLVERKIHWTVIRFYLKSIGRRSVSHKLIPRYVVSGHCKPHAVRNRFSFHRGHTNVCLCFCTTSVIL